MAKINYYPAGVPRKRSGGSDTAIHLKNQGKAKVTTDELGSKIREHWDGRQDVKVRPQSLTLKPRIQAQGE